MHITEMIFSLDVVLVVTHELIFVGEFKEDSEEPEKLFDYFCVAFLIYIQYLKILLLRSAYIRD